jgi:hypothetical protein
MLCNTAISLKTNCPTPELRTACPPCLQLNIQKAQELRDWVYETYVRPLHKKNLKSQKTPGVQDKSKHPRVCDLGTAVFTAAWAGLTESGGGSVSPPLMDFGRNVMRSVIGY